MKGKKTRTRKGFALLDVLMAGMLILAAVSIIVSAIQVIQVYSDYQEEELIKDRLRGALLILQSECSKDPEYSETETVDIYGKNGEIFLECSEVKGSLVKGKATLTVGGKSYEAITYAVKE